MLPYSRWDIGSNPLRARLSSSKKKTIAAAPAFDIDADSAIITGALLFSDFTLTHSRRLEDSLSFRTKGDEHMRELLFCRSQKAGSVIDQTDGSQKWYIIHPTYPEASFAEKGIQR